MYSKVQLGDMRGESGRGRRGGVCGNIAINVVDILQWDYCSYVFKKSVHMYVTFAWLFQDMLINSLLLGAM